MYIRYLKPQPKLSTFPNPNTTKITLSLFHTTTTRTTTTKEQEEEEEEPSVNDKPHWTKTLHALCSTRRHVDKALNLLDRLILRGYKPDALNLSSVIHALCDTRRFAEAHARLADLAHVPDERTSNVLVARLLHARSPDLTWRVVKTLVSVNPEFVPSLVNFNRLIDQLCSETKLLGAHWLLYHLQCKGHSPNSVTFTTLINGYCKIGDLVSAQKVFDEMRERKVSPNPLTFSVFIRGVLRMRDLERGKRLMEALWENMGLETDSKINNAAFSNLVESLCREGFFGEVFAIAEEMPQGKSVGEGFAYAQMIDSLCRVGKYHGASRVVYVMMKRKGLVPSFVSYNSVVHGLCNDESGCYRAYQLFEEGVKLFGYCPKETTFKKLVECLCRESEVRKAKEVLRVMLEKTENEMNRTRIYNVYLRALCFVENATEILNALVYMLQIEVKPDVITMNTVVKGLCQAGRVEEALRVSNDMRAGKFTGPDNITYTTIISGLLKLGRVDEALDILRENEFEFKPGVVTYNAVLKGLFELRREEEAMEIYNLMISKGVVADRFTYSIVIGGLCSADQIEEAKRFWDDIVWPSGNHDGFVYSAILKGLCRSGKFDEACHFLYELVDSGVSLNVFCYNIVIDCAVKSGLRAEAYQVVREMRRSGFEPDAVTWRILDKLRDGPRKLVFVADSNSIIESDNGDTRKLD